MKESPRNRFEQHPKLAMAFIWIVILIAAVAGLEWILTPVSGRHTAASGVSSPNPERYLRIREWARNTDYHMGAPKSRHRDKAGNVQDVYMLSTDANGFIEPAIRHKDADLNIVFLGGSTTECMFVKPENRFPFVVAKKLEKTLGLKINGINAARAGNTAMHSLLLFLAKVAPLKPDYVVLMHANNDISALFKYGSYWTDDGPFRLVREKGRMSDGVRAIFNHLIPYTLRTLQGARKTIESHVGSLISNTNAAENNKMKLPDETTWRHHAKAFESALRSFVSTARAWKVEPILMTQVFVKEQPKSIVEGDYITPDKLSRAGLSLERFSQMHDYFNMITRSVAKTEEVLLIDLASAREWQRGRDTYDSIHFTDSGSKSVAELVAEALKDRVAHPPRT